MWEDYRERWNEGGRLFTNRFAKLSEMNYKRFYRCMCLCAFAYGVLLLFTFCGYNYELGASDVLLMPVLVLLIFYAGKFSQMELHPQVRRFLPLAGYAVFFLAVSVFDWLSAQKGGKVQFFPMLLILFAALYVDRAVVIFVYLVICAAMNVAVCACFAPQFAGHALSADIAAVVMAIGLYWAVIGIYTDDLIHNRALEEKSSRDLLTGLFNKVSTETRIREYLAKGREGTYCALVVMDFDNFKSVNDTYGHQIGDEALKRFGEILRSNFRNLDILGRMGGDEFMLLLKEPVTEEYIVRACNQVEMDLATSHFGNAKGFTCSIGVVMDRLGFSFDNLYRLADDALYEAKARGKACYVLWQSKRIIPPDRLAIYIATANRKKADRIRSICGNGYIYYSSNEISKALNEISLYGESLETVFLDYEMGGMTKEQIEAYMASRPLFQTLPVHDIDVEIDDLHLEGAKG
ncbi:MAG: diguanylate cyclase [Lachnospiraceae bacterium]|nr:diguanylate cyclase [Lachnospiraceae bacterium]